MRRRNFLGLLLAWPAVARAEVFGDECAAVAGAPGEPFAALFTLRESTLVAVATRHTVDVQRPSAVLVRRTFESLLPELVLVEGLATDEGTSPRAFVRAPSAREAIRGGEARYAAALALEARQPFLGIEPADRDVNTALLKTFAPEDIVGALVLRALASMHGLRGQVSEALLRVYAHQTAQSRMRDDRRLADGFRDFSSWYHAAYRTSPWTDPEVGKRGTPCSAGLAGRVIKQVTRFRNEHIAEVIASVFPVASKVLLVFGAGHYRALAPLLRARYGVPRYERL